VLIIAIFRGYRVTIHFRRDRNGQG